MKTIRLFVVLSGVLLLSLSFKSINSENFQNQQQKSVQDSKKTQSSTLLNGVKNYIKSIDNGFAQITEERKKQLKKIALYIQTKNSTGDTSKLLFICTHNSRRSHMGQIWAQTAAYFYKVNSVICFSGGTEATAFNPRAVKALIKAGFDIKQTDKSSNPVYLVTYANGENQIKAFSKKYSDDFNPKNNFVAIMTCSVADKTCPNVEGSALRVAIPYEDPKAADGTPEEEKIYDERCRQIATEMFYLFSLIKAN